MYRLSAGPCAYKPHYPPISSVNTKSSISALNKLSTNRVGGGGDGGMEEETDSFKTSLNGFL